ncbi:unnamed protein product [Microthlaspi erraticum]|uniref:ABC-2 type transporter transmembrane domain-containing protein n=1 Tax=Microthlaspi erraticum TaxID=1685480 RepID=A0A6D2JKI7_9BRAS|nr:unnamed protein product [Microthlaspi erraticum]
MVTGIILATMFIKLDNSPKGVHRRLGFFAFAMSTTFYTCAEGSPVFLQACYIFMRETAYNAYQRSSYVLSQSRILIPSLIFLAGSFVATTFWAVSLGGGASGFLFFFFTILASFWVGSSFVTFLSGVVLNVMLRFTVVIAILAYFLLFSGFFISKDRIPLYWIWLHYLSLMKYPSDEMFRPRDSDFRLFAARAGAVKLNLLKSMSGVLGINMTAETCVTTGIGILKQQRITYISKWNCLLIIVAWGFFFRVLFYITLLIGSKNKRR